MARFLSFLLLMGIFLVISVVVHSHEAACPIAKLMGGCPFKGAAAEAVRDPTLKEEESDAGEVSSAIHKDSRTAFLYEKLPDNRVRCLACHRKCIISPGQTGECGVRKNDDGELKLLVHSQLISVAVDPIEKKPLSHFLPGTPILSVGTIGCNFKCPHCQNWDISQMSKKIKQSLAEQGRLDLIESEVKKYGYHVTPAQLVDTCLKHGLSLIAFTYNEPTIFTEYAYDVAKLAKPHGIKLVYVSNGYESNETMAVMGPFLDAINIDLKSFKQAFYHSLSPGVKVEPVLKNIRLAYGMGIHLEVTTLFIPDENDSEDEMQSIANFLVGVSPDIPWHVTAFHPAYEMLDKPVTPEATLVKAREIGLQAGLRYVYCGNIPNDAYMSTRCPQCGALLVERKLGRRVFLRHIRDGRCTQCGFEVYGVWNMKPTRPEVTSDLERELGFPRVATPEADEESEGASSSTHKSTDTILTHAMHVTEPIPTDQGPSLRVLFATQSGTSKAFATQLVDRARALGFNAHAADIGQYDQALLASEPLVVVIASTYGAGNCPESAYHFEQWLGDEGHPRTTLQDVQYAVFGCGRSLFGDTFCACTRRMNERLRALGAAPVVEMGEGDDARRGEQEAQWLAWQGKLLMTLAHQYRSALDTWHSKSKSTLKSEL